MPFLSLLKGRQVSLAITRRLSQLRCEVSEISASEPPASAALARPVRIIQ
jgi:hypothetical protein